MGEEEEIGSWAFRVFGGEWDLYFVVEAYTEAGAYVEGIEALDKIKDASEKERWNANLINKGFSLSEVNRPFA